MKNLKKRPLASIFGMLAAEKRKFLDMSQETLAEQVGITQVALSRIEKGKISPRFERLQAFADALHCTVAELFPGSGMVQHNAAILADLLRPLPEYEQKKIVELVFELVKLLTRK
jgi:transcriptional regulator with XRE-family HTH domain